MRSAKYVRGFLLVQEDDIATTAAAPAPAAAAAPAAAPAPAAASDELDFETDV